MPLVDHLKGKLRIPVVGAPLFIVSGPELVISQCKAGIVGSFPALNARPQEVLDEWIIRIKEELDQHNQENPDQPAAPFAVNQICHASNDRLMQDMDSCVKHEVPIIITSLRPPLEIVKAAHSYGGVVFHDVINVRHARKAAEQGVDGLILVCSGAGGHAGTHSPFALVREVKEWFDGTILLSGSISDGHSVASALALGADLAYIGTRFIATKEAPVHDNVKQRLVEASELETSLVMRPLRNTERVLNNSAVDKIKEIESNHGGDDPNSLLEEIRPLVAGSERVLRDGDLEAAAWSCGMVAGLIHDVPTCKELIDTIMQEADEIINQRLKGFASA